MMQTWSLAAPAWLPVCLSACCQTSNEDRQEINDGEKKDLPTPSHIVTVEKG